MVIAIQIKVRNFRTVFVITNPANVDDALSRARRAYDCDARAKEYASEAEAWKAD